jgi:hypothetical protein
MPTAPRGERRQADVIGAAIMVAKLATGELSEDPHPISGRTRSGQAGGKARAESLSKKDRLAIAKKAAAERWSE